MLTTAMMVNGSLSLTRSVHAPTYREVPADLPPQPRRGASSPVIALKPGHRYLRLRLQFSVALESRLLETLSEDELASLRREAAYV